VSCLTPLIFVMFALLPCRCDSMSLRFARDIVPAPRRCRKCADARRWNADMAVNITGGGGGARIGVHCAVPRGYMARASHSGSCDHGCGDQCCRQKFKLSHLISPLYMKSHVPVLERHFAAFAPEPSLVSRVMTRAIAPREGM